MRLIAFISFMALVFTAPLASAATLEVGPGKPYQSIQAAISAAKKGDDISVFRAKNSAFYDKTAVLVKTPDLHIHAADPEEPIAINGAGFEYSGAGKIPRAIFQFNPTASGCTLEGFDLSGAHNDSHNGAGVRINAANAVTIRDCTIHHNDMGIMSNGELKNNTGDHQLIEFCLIEKNGDFKDPGYNHNLYLGGTSVTVRGCEIAFSLTGHNLKSRAHHNWIEYNYIHDSANRELDLVDGVGNTDAPGSDSVLLGNIIVKAARTKGNKNVIHFGKDGKASHHGTIYLVHNSISTPYLSPVLDVNTDDASAQFSNNVVEKKSGGKGTLVSLENGARAANVTGSGNSFEGSFTQVAGVEVQAGPPAKDVLPWSAFHKKSAPLMQYTAPRKIEPRHDGGPGAAGGIQ